MIVALQSRMKMRECRVFTAALPKEEKASAETLAFALGGAADRSEHKLQGELHLTAAGGRRIQRSEIASAGEIRGSIAIKESAIDDRRIEVRPIKYVKYLRPELETHPLRDVSVLDQREIEVDQAGAIDIVSACVAEQVGASARRYNAAGGEGNAIRSNRGSSHR